MSAGDRRLRTLFEMAARAIGERGQHEVASLVADREFGLAREAESRALCARGSIFELAHTGASEPVDLPYDGNGATFKGSRPVAPRVARNRNGKIDGARLISCEDGHLIIRVDDSNVPSFWVEIDVPLNKLFEFVGREDPQAGKRKTRSD